MVTAQDRNRADMDMRYITREEFSVHAAEQVELKEEMRTQTIMLCRLERAVFSKEVDSEFDSPGLMVIANKISNHIDMVCSIGRAVSRGLIVFLGAAASLAAIGHNVGWW